MISTFAPLIRVVLTGCRGLEWLPIFVARFSLGLFFAVSGYNKLFAAAKHEDLIQLMTKIGIPFPDLMALFLAALDELRESPRVKCEPCQSPSRHVGVSPGMPRFTETTGGRFNPE